MHVKLYVQEQIKIYSWKNSRLKECRIIDLNLLRVCLKLLKLLWESLCEISRAIHTLVERYLFCTKGRVSNENCVFCRKDKEHWGLVLILGKEIKILWENSLNFPANYLLSFYSWPLSRVSFFSFLNLFFIKV